MSKGRRLRAGIAVTTAATASFGFTGAAEAYAHVATPVELSTSAPADGPGGSENAGQDVDGSHGSKPSPAGGKKRKNSRRTAQPAVPIGPPRKSAPSTVNAQRVVVYARDLAGGSFEMPAGGSVSATLDTLVEDDDETYVEVWFDPSDLSPTDAGTLTVTGSSLTDSFTFTAAEGFAGHASIGYTAVTDDGDEMTAHLMFDVARPDVVNTPPVANPDSVTLQPGEEAVVEVTDNDSDIDNGDQISLVGLSPDDIDDVAIAIDGSSVLVTVGDDAEPGTRLFSYTIEDKDEAQSTGALIVTVEGDTPDPTTPDPVTPDPVTPDPVTPDPVTPDPVTPDPTTPDPVTPDPITPDPTTPDPTTPDPTTPDPTTPDPITPDPTTPGTPATTPDESQPVNTPTGLPRPVVPEEATRPVVRERAITNSTRYPSLNRRPALRPRLPETGAEIGGLLTIGLALLASGTTLVRVARRRPGSA